ncbi:synaptonemal complex protein 2-like [Pimephales promelas]|uniref:synaptonemal complex protein 2-like n=1 Tax=Pimephales promelas TaxID=90988 RepID=UPI001955CAE0|nr:synaptonemal complex protein 2-like [Pimephales promelas]
MKPMVKPALQMMSSSERKKEIEIRDLMMSKTSFFHCENDQKKAHAIQAQSTPAAQNEDQQKIQSIKAKGKKYRKNIPVDKVVEMVHADTEYEENTFDNSIVPDSQPVVKGSSISPGLWNSSKMRISVSGSLLEKDRSKKCSVSDGSSHPPPRRLSPAQCASKTLTHNQLQTQLTQRLEEVLKKQQGTDGHATQRGSSLEPRTASQEKEKVEKSVRSMPARPTQQRGKSSKVKGDASDLENVTCGTDSMVKMISSHYKISAKAASPDPGAQFASTNRYLFKKSSHPSSTEKTAAKSSSLLKSKRPTQKLEDIYAFTEDTPTISVRKKSSDSSRVESSALSNSPAFSKSARKLPKVAATNVNKHLFSDTDTDNMTEVSWLKSANRKPKPKVADYSRQPVKPTFPSADSAFKSPFTPSPSPKPVKEQIKPKRKRQKKVAEQEDKQQPSIKNKKATGRPQRAAALTKTYREPSDSDDQSSLSESEKAPPSKKKAVVRPVTSQQTVPPQAAGREQKREKTSVEVARQQSETNVLKKAEKAIVKTQPDLRIDKGKKLSDAEDLTVKKTSSAQRSARRQKESWAARLSSTFASPPSIERMRSAEKITNVRSNTTPLRSLSISPIDADSSPLEPLSPLKEIQAPSRCKTLGKKGAVKPPFSITPVSTSSRGCKKNRPTAQVELSPVHSLLTSTQPLVIKEKCTLSSPIISPDLQEEHMGDMNRTSPASFGRGSVISMTMTQSVSNFAMMCTELEKTPASKQGSKAERPEFKSGPSSIHHKHLIPCQSADFSEVDEDSEEDKENKAPSPSQIAQKMKPRKLFMPTDKHWTPSKGPNTKLLVKDQSSSEEEDEDIVADNGRRKKSYQRGLNKRAKETTISIEEVETLSSCTRSSCRRDSVEGDIDLTQPAQEVGFICHQFSSEIKRKLKNRCRTMDLYTRQSLKTLQQHMSSVSVQVHQYSSQRLEKVKQVLLGEIEDLEQDDMALRSMEEELTTYWQKQTLAFHKYQEKGTKRLQRLKSTVQTDAHDCLDYEEQIFSLEVSLMKKNMKSVQERFFKEMHDEDLTSVRRGLQSLFFPDPSRF